MSDRKQIFDIEITTRCNKQCSICPRQNFTRRDRDMSLDTFEKLCDWLPNGSVVFFAGYGEPTLHDNLTEFISRLSKKGISVSIMTNGKLLSRGKIRGLYEAGLQKLQISVLPKDGTPEVTRFVDMIDREFYSKTRFNLIYDENTGIPAHLTVSLEKFGFEIECKRVHSRGGHLYIGATETNSFPCGTFLYVTYVDTDGGLQICSNDINGEHNLGNISTMTFEHFFDMKKRFDRGRVVAPICKVCDDEYRRLNLRE